MDLISPDFSNGEAIPRGFTCEGENRSPALEWRHAPEGTRSFALTCEDPDAPGVPFVHWVVWGIDPGREGVGPGEVPEDARQGRNDYGETGYGGPCPPRGRGRHRYYFTLYAMSEPVALGEGASIDELRREMRGKVLEEASLMGTYER